MNIYTRFHHQVTDVEVALAVENKHNFASDIYRARLQYTNQDDGKMEWTSVFVKSMTASEGCKRQIVQNLPVFDTEIQMYSEALPAIKLLLGESLWPR